MEETGVPPRQPVSQDPIIDFLNRVQISDDFVKDIWESGKSFDSYQKYYKASDLFIILQMLNQVETWEPEPNNPDFIAFRTLMKWFIYLMGTNPWWHRKLAYYNRMMGTCMASTSYWKLTYHPGYIPGAHWKADNLSKTPEEFNKEIMSQEETYAWIDQNVTASCDHGLDFDDDDIINPKKTNPIKPRKDKST